MRHAAPVQKTLVFLGALCKDATFVMNDMRSCRISYRSSFAVVGIESAKNGSGLEGAEKSRDKC